MVDQLDSIDKSIDIDATAERVWDLISTPGWYVNEGSIGENEIEDRGDHVIVRHPVHGAFPIRTEKLDPPRYAAFRWMSSETPEVYPSDSKTTLVEFWIEDRPGGGVTLRILESGFASLEGTSEHRRQLFDEHSGGWDFELGVARKFVEQ